MVTLCWLSFFGLFICSLQTDFKRGSLYHTDYECAHQTSVWASHLPLLNMLCSAKLGKVRTYEITEFLLYDPVEDQSNDYNKVQLAKTISLYWGSQQKYMCEVWVHTGAGMSQLHVQPLSMKDGLQNLQLTGIWTGPRISSQHLIQPVSYYAIIYS